MFRFSLLSVALVFSGFSALAAPGFVAPPDSIGVEYRNNKMLIKHRVAAGETLYGVARRYKVPVEQIVEVNAGLKGALVTGQVVLVPRQRAVMPNPAAPKPATPIKAPAATGAVRTLPPATRGNRVHKVAAGQTLFSIARLYNTTPQALAQLNGFAPNYNVRIGQTLLIARAAAAPAARPATPAPKPAAPATREPAVAATPAPAKSTPTPAATTSPVPTPAIVQPARPEQPAQNERPRDTATTSTVAPATEKEEERAPERASEIVRRVTESGLATSIANSNTDKYLALHKTAAVGTIMQVRNIMNGQSVYVRVIGVLPNTGENNNILVRLSPRAVQRLATPDARFRVETSYVP
ncbi:LysM peptidoglycan-binding domain-containing protein [Hymenobacter sp. YC55]|uniref:LysM peptidoglycan-binding domain-containing protein n=1 Tax=Hymenobacter sp. YC55 TaxID=3034019 RepID=UPI0023F8EC90|nr:LysM peptidoglycan-binding domain-containing protein [Hymenobacter sp. YC55]MDF7811928.1 LysM peptidoglycan-binding domain-containing protein [Hymenobacter sp. YC55]